MPGVRIHEVPAGDDYHRPADIGNDRIPLPPPFCYRDSTRPGARGVSDIMKSWDPGGEKTRLTLKIPTNHHETNKIMPGSTMDSTSSTETGPLGSGEHLVRQGECIESIAATEGHVWKTIWDAPENAELKAKRVNHNTLLPGDAVHIPPLRKQEEACATEKRHRFRRKGVPAKLILVLLDTKGDPRKNLAYVMHIDGSKRSGSTNGSGKIEQKLPPLAQTAHLSIPSTGEKYKLLLRQLGPLSEPVGVQGRLRNLGHYLGTLDGKLGTLSHAAITQFQVSKKVDPSGKADAALSDNLKEVYGQ